MTSITRILNWGEWRTVWLACGHRHKVRRGDLKQGQFYIGKPITCAMCAIKKSKGQAQ